MKTSLFSSHVFCNAFFTFLLFGISHVISAQCPIINNTNPNICLEGAGYSFKDLNSFVTDSGNEIVWYDVETGGVQYNPNELVTEGTYYAGNTLGTCSNREALFVDFLVNGSGQVLDRIYCSKDNADFQSYIDDVLQPFIPAEVGVVIYSDLELTDPISPTDIIPIGAATYYMVLVDTSGCKSQIERGQIGVFATPSDPKPESQQLFCSGSNPTVEDLNTDTDPSVFYNWYESLDSNGNPILPALLPTDTLVSSKTYYLQIEGVFCSSNPVSVLVEINTEESGSSNSLSYCENDLPVSSFNLFDALGDPKDNTGTWTGPVSTSNDYFGTVDISTLTAGNFVFTYSVPTNGACPNLTSTITIEIDETLSSGIPLSPNPITFCTASLPSAFDLSAQLTGQDLGGQWIAGTLITDPVITSPIDLSTFNTGTYYFTYIQNLPPNICSEESTTIQVDILTDPNAGNAISQIFCENNVIVNSPFDLFTALDGTQSNNNGVWRDVNNNSISNLLDITGFTFSGSPYRFSYTVGDLDCSDIETITINIDEGPESGIANVPANFCQGLAPENYDLFDLLTGADQLGTWFIGTDNSGTITTNPIDISGLAEGTYNYTYEVTPIGTCTDEPVTVQIIIIPLPNTGTPSGAIFCENDLVANSPLDLFGQLDGEDPGGIWTDGSASGALSGSEVDLTSLAIGFYNYTYTITNVNDCAKSSTVVVTIKETPESGTANAPAAFCEGSTPTSFDLFSLLNGADQTGTWFLGTDNSGTITTNPIDISGLAEGTYNYTYEVTPIGTCTGELVTVEIIINPLPNTGTPSGAIFCENDLAANSPLDLLGQLSGETAGGAWTDDSGSGAIIGSSVDLTILSVGSYNYTYTITDPNDCTNSSTVVVTVGDAPESGTPNLPAEFCKSELIADQTFDLFDLLQGSDFTGIWNDDDATSTLSGSTVNLFGLPVGTSNFTYNVDAIGSCDDVDITVSIIINDIVSPTAETVQEFCDNATVIELIATGTSINWYDALIGGDLLDNTIALIDGQIYYASQTDPTTSCESASRIGVTATIYQSPNTGGGIPLAVCDNDSTVDLFNALDGTQDTGGTWRNNDSVGTLTGNIFDATGVATGSYEFTYLVKASVPCVDNEITITVDVEEPLNAGTNNTLDVCSDNGTTDLFSLLGSADSGGIWSPALTSGTGVFDPLIDAQETYTYSLSNSCGTFVSEVIVTITQAPDAGTDDILIICSGDNPIDLFDLLGSTAQTGGTWLPALTSGTGVFDPEIDVQGSYTYTVTALAPCSLEDIAEIIVTIDDTPALIVLDPNPEFCLLDGPTVADLGTSIRPTGTVNWYEDATLTLALLSTDNLENGEDYFATQTNSTGCESSIAVQINVTINDSPTPTLSDTSVDYCLNDEPTINDLSLNVTEYNASSDNLIWYDSETGGTAYDSSTTLSNITYYAAVINTASGCESSTRLTVIPDVTACEKLEFPDGFSPNGDGINDTLDVDFLGILYPNFIMEIYNRYGNIVYKGNANTPRFDGTANQSKAVSKGDLPVGVYFYIFNFNDGENPPEQGRIYLSR